MVGGEDKLLLRQPFHHDRLHGEGLDELRHCAVDHQQRSIEGAQGPEVDRLKRLGPGELGDEHLGSRVKPGSGADGGALGSISAHLNLLRLAGLVHIRLK